MKVFARYLRTQLWTWSVLVLLVLVGIVVVMDLIHLLSKLGEDLGWVEVLYLAGLAVPGNLYEMLPIAVLIGGLMGFGNLAAQSELTAARALGYSRRRIVYSVLHPKTIGPFILAMLVLGEVIVPLSENLAVKVEQRTEQGTDKFQDAELDLWVRDGNYFIHVERVDGDKHQNATFYEYDPERGRLLSISRTESMVVGEKHFDLRDLVHTRIDEDKITVLPLRHTKIARAGGFGSGSLKTVEPRHLSSRKLFFYVDSLKRNKLHSDGYELFLWQRGGNILSLLALLLVAMPFVFSRAGGTASDRRLLIGIAVGVIYTVVNKFAGPLAIILSWPVWIGAFIAPVACCLGSLLHLRRQN